MITKEDIFHGIFFPGIFYFVYTNKFLLGFYGLFSLVIYTYLKKHKAVNNGTPTTE